MPVSVWWKTVGSDYDSTEKKWICACRTRLRSRMLRARTNQNQLHLIVCKYITKKKCWAHFISGKKHERATGDKIENSFAAVTKATFATLWLLVRNRTDRHNFIYGKEGSKLFIMFVFLFFIFFQALDTARQSRLRIKKFRYQHDRIKYTKWNTHLNKKEHLNILFKCKYTARPNQIENSMHKQNVIFYLNLVYGNRNARSRK